MYFKLSGTKGDSQEDMDGPIHTMDFTAEMNQDGYQNGYQDGRRDSRRDSNLESQWQNGHEEPHLPPDDRSHRVHSGGTVDSTPCTALHARLWTTFRIFLFLW